MLIHFGITPYLVFDGDNLPSKSGTEKERREKRKESRRLGLELIGVGKTVEARLMLQKSVDVTPEMARMLIEELKHHNIQYVVAPYEADSQLAYLERKGIIQGILSEDSDLLVFGAKCLITKLDKYGECVEINRNQFTACREISLAGWTDEDFRRMAILSGCDYLPGVGGMGLKTAYRMLKKHKNVERLIKAAQFDGKHKVPNGFLEAFYQAEKTFLYQWVFCPVANHLVNLTPPDSKIDITKMPFIGEEVPPHVAYGVAKGELHPHSKQPLALRTDFKPQGKPLRSPRVVPTAQTPASKHGRPIESFFKAKRTPLAELDINLFTPSPSQQALLEQQRNSTGWEGVPAPQTSQRQRPSQASSAPQPFRRTISDAMGPRRPAPYPVKRQRLCSDSISDPVHSRNGDATRSQFFPLPLTEPSPSLRSSKDGRRKPKQDVGLYSDDSIEDFIASFVDPDEPASQPRKKLKVFKDSFTSSLATDSQSTIFSRSATEPSQDSLASGIATPATSFGSPEPESIFSAPLSQQIKDLRSRYLYSQASCPPTQSSQKSEPIRRFSISKLKQQSFHVSTAEVAQSQGNDGLIEDSAWAAMEAEVVVAASDTEDLSAGPNTPSKQLDVKGSEELLVLESSDIESICSPRKPLLNLGRFAFNS